MRSGGRRRWGSFVLAAAVLTSPRIWIESVQWTLSLKAPAWRQLVFLDGLTGLVTDQQAAQFGFGSDPEFGDTLSVGPWHAGSYAARLEYRTAFPQPTGTIRGHYRTEGLLPFQAAVHVSFTRGSEVLAKTKVYLAPSPSWQPFTVPVRFPPAGADSFLAAVELSDKTSGKAEFARLSISGTVEDLALPAEPGSITRPPPPASFEPGATYRLAQHEGTSWLVAPSGKALYSMATVGPAGRSGETPSAPTEGWAAYLRGFGFNSLAAWTRVSYWSGVNDALLGGGGQPLPLFAAIESNSLGASFERLVDARGETGSHPFPDPFDPAYESAYRAEVASLHRYVGGREWFAGWFADNEVSHEDLHRRVYSTHCAAAFKEFLTGRHGTIDALNRAWGRSYRSFDELILARPDPLLPDEAMAADFRLFAREIVRRYVDVTIRSIRSADAGGLIFSNRFMASGIGVVADNLDLYARYDGIAVNLYPRNQAAGLSDNERAYLGLFHERTGRPVLVSEWSVPALDSGLYDAPPVGLDWSWNEVVGTQAERARQAATLTVDFYNLPFVVGAQWFTWRDYRDERYANRGLLGADGQPWEELLDRLRAAHRRIGL